VLVLLFLQILKHFKILITQRAASLPFFRSVGVVFNVEVLSDFSGSSIMVFKGFIIVAKMFFECYI